MPKIPFNTPSDEQRRQISSLATEIFNGRYDEELFNEYSEWIPFIVDVFLPLIDSEKGDFIHLPFTGGLSEQGYVTMNILKIIQGTYRKVQSDRLTKKMKKR